MSRNTVFTICQSIMINRSFSLLVKTITPCFLAGCISLACNTLVQASPFTQEQLQWLNSDDEHPALSVNEGELHFLATAATTTEHHHKTTITITDETIKDGWVRLDQCHSNLGLIESLEIVYHPERIQSLQIVSIRNIGRARANNNKIELKKIDLDSRICIQASSHALWPAEEKHYELRNGPFMRRFLDGYYPLHITLKVIYPSHRLQLIDIHPKAQAGWSIQQGSDTVTADGRFEGKLHTRFLFKSN